MATRYVRRGSSLIGNAGFPSANSIRVDSGTDVLKFGTGSSGTTEKEVLDLTSTQTVTGVKTFAAGSVTLPESSLRVATVAVTNAEMLALRATPKTLVAAPGAGKVIEFLSAEIFLNNTAAYTEGAVNSAFRLKDSTGPIVSQTIESTAFVDQTGGIKNNVLPKIDAISSKANCDNQPLLWHNTGGAEFGAGNAANTISVRVSYRVHSVTW